MSAEMNGVQPILQARGLMKRYGTVVAMSGCDFELMPGEILAVIGDNGAGKSTMIKALSGAVVPDHGEILLDGQPVHFRSPDDARALGIETVYQNLAMSPALSIADNMFLGREWRKPGILGSVFRKMDRTRMEKFARDKLSELGLMTIQDITQPVETLSGGQRQGVAVARAAAFGSKVVILDEPTAALGVKESRRVLELIRVQDMTAYVKKATRNKGVVPQWSGARMSFSGELADASLAVLADMHRGAFDTPEARAIQPLIELQRKWSPDDTACR